METRPGSPRVWVFASEHPSRRRSPAWLRPEDGRLKFGNYSTSRKSKWITPWMNSDIYNHIHTYITLHYITLHYIKLHYITLHYIHTYTHIHIYLPTYLHTYIQTSIHPYIHTSIHHHTSIHPYIHTSIIIHTCMYIYIYIYYGEYHEPFDFQGDISAGWRCRKFRKWIVMKYMGINQRNTIQPYSTNDAKVVSAMSCCPVWSSKTSTRTSCLSFFQVAIGCNWGFPWGYPQSSSISRWDVPHLSIIDVVTNPTVLSHETFSLFEMLSNIVFIGPCCNHWWDPFLMIINKNNHRIKCGVNWGFP